MAPIKKKTQIFSKFLMKMFKFYVFKEHFSKISKVRLKKCNKILRGVISAIFSDVSNTQKLPGPFPDSPRPSPGLGVILDLFTH